MTQEQLDYTQEYHELPPGWEWVRLDSICDAINGRAFKSTEWRDEGLPIIRIQNLKDPEAPFNCFQGDLKDQHRVASGDLLFAWSGTPGTSFGAHIWKGPDAALNQHIFNIRFDRDEIDPKYFLYALNQNVTRYVEQAQGGVGLAHITKSKFLASSIPLAPLAQQKRIVAEIEKQSSRLDEAVANLKRVKANLQRYKAAVLKAAVEGKLTEEWRKAHPDIEPASKLLDRILAERRAKWEEAELAKMEAKGKAPKNDKWKAKYQAPTAPDASSLPELPKGWRWARLDAIAALKGGITVDKKRHDPTARSVPYLRVANVQRGYLDLAEVKTIDAPEKIIQELRLQSGDVLFNEGGDRDKLGRGWIWEGQLPECIHQNHVFRARLYLDEVSPKLVSWWGNSFGRDYFLREGKQTTNLASINLTKLSAFPIPLPPVAEQRRVVVEVERHLSLINGAATQVDDDLLRADRLRQTILAKAFAGKLVPEDPNAEPASALLARIQLGSAQKEIGKRKKPRPAKPGTKEVTVMELIEALKDAGDWISAQEAFRRCGIGDGADTDAIEQLYAELRDRVKCGTVDVERRADEDWLRVSPGKEA